MMESGELYIFKNITKFFFQKLPNNQQVKTNLFGNRLVERWPWILAPAETL